MTPLLERQPVADTGTHSAPRAHAGAQHAPTPPSSMKSNAGAVAPAARSRRRPGGDGDAGSARVVAAAEGAFVCRTCSRRFPSFQALGGHRTGHTRLLARHALPQRQQKPAARAAHECAVCGLEFAMGQALGGHMRRHKLQASDSEAQAPVEVEVGQQKEDTVDLSCPPPLEEHSGDDGAEGCSSGSGSEPRLLNLLV